MILRYLLDENISPIVADQVKRHQPEISIDSVHRWRDGAFVNQEDEKILLAAASEGLTLVTYDMKTIPSLVDRFLEEGWMHAGVIYIDEKTMTNRNYGLIVRALIELWNSNIVSDWRNYEHYLEKPKF